MVDFVILTLPNPTNPRADTDTEDVKDEILIDSAISEVCGTLDVQASQGCTGGGRDRRRAKLN